ncbi:hypothetical protein EDC96DRAFT_595861 [Choanephora cucurbitarum]|nr:hypothetical protein EDC96DRAFT_595861 [Choanephora cucurbitarum]
MSDSEDDQLNDYSLLLKKKNNVKLKRGSKTNDHVNLDRLETARSALFECLSQPPKPSAKSSSKGVLSREYPYHTRIVQNKGTHLHSMGFSLKGVITLYPEEAAFLVSRNALIVVEEEREAQRDVLFEDYCEIMCTKSDDWITFDKYLVYAYLKRLGFIVMRAQQPTSSRPKSPSFWRLLLDKMLNWHQRKKTHGPLAWRYSHKTYTSLYSTLQIVPCSPWYRPFESLVGMDWYVYKPRPSFSKKNPGQPDFKVIVRHVRDSVPSLDEQHQLFGQENQFVVALVGDADGITFLRMNGDDMQDISQRLHTIKAQKKQFHIEK